MRSPFFRCLLWLVLRGEGSEFVRGDIDEDYHALLRSKGRASANQWYREQAVTSAWAWVKRTRDAVIQGWWRDLRYGARSLVRSAGYSTAAVLTLGLGLGGTVAVVALGQTLLSPLPFPDADRLVSVWETRNGNVRSVAPANYLDWRRTTTAFTGMAAHDMRSASLTVESVALRGRVAVVSGNFFQVLGVTAVAGRAFSPELNTAFESREAVISHSRWRDLYGYDPRVVGQTFQVEEVTYSIVGVAPDGLSFPEPDTDAWLRSATEAPEIAGFQGDLPSLRDAWYFEVFGRLAEGIELGVARDEMKAIAQRLTEEYPETNEGEGTMLVPLLEQAVADFRPTLLALALAVVLVMLASLVNVTHLMLARSEARGGEMAVRTALGAGRTTLFRQVALEGGLLGFAGGLTAIALAQVAVTSGVRWMAATLPRANEVGIHGSTALAAVTFGTAMGVIVAVAAHAGSLRRGGRLVRSGGRTVPGGSAQRGLVAMQVAAAIALLASAVLLGRSLQGLAAVDLGFAVDETITMRVAIPGARGRAYVERLQAYDELVGALAAIPGVQAVGYGSGSPLNVGLSAGVFLFGEEHGQNPPNAGWQPITATYFDALGMTVLRGRPFNQTDLDDSPYVGIVNEALAREVFAGTDPLGRQITIGFDGHDRAITIVGVVADTRTRGPASAAAGVLYRPITQTRRHSATTAFFAIRARNADGALLAQARQTVREIAPTLPVYDEALGSELARPFRTAQTTLLGVLVVFAMTALLLGAVGVYGVATYSVRRRRREIGVRMALGADRGNVVRHVVGSGLLRASIGVPIGIVLTLLLGRALNSVLFSVSPADPRSLATACVIVMAVVGGALLLPAVAAANTDPADAIRSD